MTSGSSKRPTWRNHFAPEFYLANFVDRTGELWRTFKPPSGQLHERRYPPKETGYQKDLYSLERDFDIGPFGPTDRIEREVFAPIDRQAAPVLRKLMTGPPSALDEIERHRWAVFVNSLIERRGHHDAEGRALATTPNHHE